MECSFVVLQWGLGWLFEIVMCDDDGVLFLSYFFLFCSLRMIYICSFFENWIYFLVSGIEGGRLSGNI